MPWYPPQGSAASSGYDFAGATTNGAESLQLGTIPVPANFNGFVQVRVAARFVQAAPAAEIPMSRTIRAYITKGTMSGPITVVNSNKIAAETYEAGIGYSLGTTLLPGLNDSSIMEVRVTGIASGVTYWDGHADLWGREQGSDG
jgi:hypothetical protein